MTDTTHSRKEQDRIVRAAGVVGFATGLSRVFGFLRDMIAAALFGAGLATDAFFVAFRIPNLLRRLFAEGSLTVSFVPVFTEYLKTRTREEALELADIAFTALSAILVVVSLAGILLSPLIVAVMAPGFARIPGHHELAVFLTRLMFPYILFISLVALCMGILNSLRHFAAPALSPVVLNVSMIVAAVFLRHLFHEPITALAVGVLAGGVLQLVMQWPVLRRLGVRIRPNFRFRHPGIARIIRLMAPAVFGAAIYQINILIGTILASLLPGGSVSYLYYADRIVELPLGVFAIAIGTATLPSFSAQVADGRIEDFKRSIAFSLRLILFVTIPATVALILLRVPIISVLFERGAFDGRSTELTARALLFYTLGLWAFSAIRVIVSSFYALQDTKNPLRAAVAALVVNVAFSVVLMTPMQHGGLALATSLASAANVLILAGILWKRIGSFLGPDDCRSAGKVLLAALGMGGALILVEWFFPWQARGPFGDRLAFLVISVATGLVVFFVFAWRLGCPEMVFLMDRIRRRFGGGGKPPQPAGADKPFDFK